MVAMAHPHQDPPPDLPRRSFFGVFRYSRRALGLVWTTSRGLTVTLGVTNVSFVAQIVDWNAQLRHQVIEMAHRHKGTGFVRIIQRCPVYVDSIGKTLQDEPARLKLLTHENGIQVDDSVRKPFPNHAEHDPSDLAAALTIAAKDLKERLRDRSAIVLAVVVPLGLAFVLNLTLGPITEEGFSTDVAVADADGGAVAQAFSGVLTEIEDAEFITVTETPDGSAARVMIADDQISTAYLIPDGFSNAVGMGEEAVITVVANPDQPIGAQVGAAIAEGFAGEVNAVRLSVATALALGADDPEALAATASAEPAPIALADGQTEGRGFDFATFYATGIAVFFLFFTVQFGVLGIIDERETGTMPRLLVAPISKQAILVGKLAASFLMGVASTVVLWLATTLLMGADWGSSIGVLILIFAGVAAAMGLTAAIATFTNTAEQAGAITAFIVVVFGVLGGVFFPVSRVSGAFEVVARIAPHFWLMDGFQRLSAGEGIFDIAPALAAIIFFVFVLPIVLILVLGLVFGSGFQSRVAVVVPVDDERARALFDEIARTRLTRILPHRWGDGLDAGEGNDRIIPGDGTGGYVEGGAGRDRIIVRAEGDNDLIGGPGRDTVDFRRSPSPMYVNLSLGRFWSTSAGSVRSRVSTNATGVESATRPSRSTRSRRSRSGSSSACRRSGCRS